MRVTTGSTWETPLGTRRFDVELTEDDGERLWPGNWSTMSVHQRFLRLQCEADAMVMAYLARDGVVSADYARTRIADLRSRVKDQS